MGFLEEARARFRAWRKERTARHKHEAAEERHSRPDLQPTRHSSFSSPSASSSFPHHHARPSSRSSVTPLAGYHEELRDAAYHAIHGDDDDQRHRPSRALSNMHVSSPTSMPHHSPSASQHQYGMHVISSFASPSASPSLPAPRDNGEDDDQDESAARRRQLQHEFDEAGPESPDDDARLAQMLQQQELLSFLDAPGEGEGEDGSFSPNQIRAAWIAHQTYEQGQEERRRLWRARRRRREAEAALAEAASSSSSTEPPLLSRALTSRQRSYSHAIGGIQSPTPVHHHSASSSLSSQQAATNHPYRHDHDHPRPLTRHELNALPTFPYQPCTLRRRFQRAMTAPIVPLYKPEQEEKEQKLESVQPVADTAVTANDSTPQTMLPSVTLPVDGDATQSTSTGPAAVPLSVVEKRSDTMERVEEEAEAEGDEEDERPSCNICLCEYEVGDELLCLPCTHRYHVRCISDWLGRSSICPNCNFDVRSVFCTVSDV